MNKETIRSIALDFMESSPLARVSEEKAFESVFVGMPMFEDIVIKCAGARDEYLLGLPAVPEAQIALASPEFWLPSAKTVISIFLAFTKQVKKSNAGKEPEPSSEWLHARIEGQVFINELSRHLQRAICEAGYEAVVPSLDARFSSTPFLEQGDAGGLSVYTSNWSERHVAYAAGHGTFSLSKGLITEAGVAGRFCSLVTSLELPPDSRPYTGLYDYCVMCGACVRKCPAGAISIHKGKEHGPCSSFLYEVKQSRKTHYGCGKCQAGVPCESGIPGKQKAAN